MSQLTSTFATIYGVVTVSRSFSKLGFDKKQADVTYKPNDYNGWGIVRTVCAIEVQDFEQADAEFFASVAESKLRTRAPSEVTA
jgi:hypothetical protein